MDIYEGLFGASDMLCEQIIRHLTESFVEEGPVVAVFDGKGGCWSTSPQGWEPLLARRELLLGYCQRVADGWEPVTGLVDGWGILAGQLHAAGQHHGYVVIGLPSGTAESAALHQPLLETVLNQVNAIAELIHKNNQLHHHQLKAMSQTLTKEPSCVN